MEMDRAELKATLDRERVDPATYCFDCGLPNDAFVLSQEPLGRWSVYHSERGSKFSEKIFDSEDAACRQLLQTLLRFPSTRKRPAE
jgi:hypothetical protein